MKIGIIIETKEYEKAWNALVGNKSKISKFYKIQSFI